MPVTHNGREKTMLSTNVDVRSNVKGTQPTNQRKKRYGTIIHGILRTLQKQEKVNTDERPLLLKVGPKSSTPGNVSFCDNDNTSTTGLISRAETTSTRTISHHTSSRYSVVKSVITFDNVDIKECECDTNGSEDFSHNEDDDQDRSTTNDDDDSSSSDSFTVTYIPWSRPMTSKDGNPMHDASTKSILSDHNMNDEEFYNPFSPFYGKNVVLTSPEDDCEKIVSDGGSLVDTSVSSNNWNEASCTRNFASMVAKHLDTYASYSTKGVSELDLNQHRNRHTNAVTLSVVPEMHDTHDIQGNLNHNCQDSISVHQNSVSRTKMTASVTDYVYCTIQTDNVEEGKTNCSTDSPKLDTMQLNRHSNSSSLRIQKKCNPGNLKNVPHEIVIIKNRLRISHIQTSTNLDNPFDDLSTLANETIAGNDYRYRDYYTNAPSSLLSRIIPGNGTTGITRQSLLTLPNQMSPPQWYTPQSFADNEFMDPNLYYHFFNNITGIENAAFSSPAYSPTNSNSNLYGLVSPVLDHPGCNADNGLLKPPATLETVNHEEICPGVRGRLLANICETNQAFEQGNIIFPTCVVCKCDLVCIATAEYVLCSECKVLSPVSTSPIHVPMNSGGCPILCEHEPLCKGGIGLGIPARNFQ